MTHTPDPAATPQAQDAGLSAEVKPARSRLRDQIAENPLAGLMLAVLTFLGTVVVALLLFTLNSLGERIDGIEARLGERIDRLEIRLGERMDHLEVRMDRLEERMGRLEERMGRLDARLSAQIAELDRKLTALIAHLNATEAVEAALEHRLLIPDVATTESEGERPG